MKRDWKLIRAILHGEKLDGWPPPVVTHHYALCYDRGLVTGEWGMTREGPVFHFYRLTYEGEEMAALLSCPHRLTVVLEELDEKHVGHVEGIVIGKMKLLADY